MSVNGIASHFQNSSDLLVGQTNETNSPTNATAAKIAAKTAVEEDVFTPSSQNGGAQAAQDAGIFQIPPGAATWSSARIPFDNSAWRGNQNGSADMALPARAANTGAPQAATPTKPGTSENAGQKSENTPAAQAPDSPAATANLQIQLQSLNAALPPLGLTNIEINQIDRIASLVQNFNPAAYASLVHQFEALAQQATPSVVVNTAVTSGTNPATNTGTGRNGSSFHVQQILLTFAGAQQTAGDSSTPNSGGQGSAANRAQPAASGLQMAKVQFTLIDGSGQIVQVQAP